MGLSLAALLAPTTATEAETDLIAAFDSFGFPASSWQPKSVPRTLLKWFATKYASVTITIATITKGGFLSTAAELKNADGTDKVDWLDLKVASDYDEVRVGATSTEGTMRLSNTSGSPHTIAVGQLWAQDAAGRRFNNQTGGTLAAPDGSTLDLTWKAESPGSAYNIPNNSIAAELVTPIPGVAVTNPAVGSTGTWITTAGGDAESNDTFADRAGAKWNTLGTGGGADAYLAWAKAGAPSVSKALVDDANPDGPGTVRVYLANAAGPATPGEIAAALAYIAPRRALTARVSVLAAVAKEVTVTASIEVLAVYSSTAAAQAATNIATYAQALDIGEDVYLSELITALSSPTGVRRVTITEPAADVSVVPYEIVTITLNLTTVVV